MEYKSFNVEAWAESEEQRIRGMLARDRNGDRVAKIRLDMGNTMNRHMGVYRNEDGMKEALISIKGLKERYGKVPVEDKGRIFNTDLVFALELGFMLECAEATVASGLERKESRGAQSRTDYPLRDDENWLRHVLVVSSEDGPQVSYAPVTITQWQPEERKY
jgi:succinate dehydrogenase / fumarate reductase flavoprotein subunit